MVRCSHELFVLQRDSTQTVNETCKKAFELVVLKFRLSWYIEATYACFLVEIEEEQEREEKMRSTLSSKQGTLQIGYMMIIAW